MTGLTGDICVLFTASDAYMRDFHLFVPRDCVASADPRENEHALEHMRRVLKADTRPSAEIDFEELKRRAARAGPTRAQARQFAQTKSAPPPAFVLVSGPARYVYYVNSPCPSARVSVVIRLIQSPIRFTEGRGLAPPISLRDDFESAKRNGLTS